MTSGSMRPDFPGQSGGVKSSDSLLGQCVFFGAGAGATATWAISLIIVQAYSAAGTPTPDSGLAVVGVPCCAGLLSVFLGSLLSRITYKSRGSWQSIGLSALVFGLAELVLVSLVFGTSGDTAINYSVLSAMELAIVLPSVIGNLVSMLVVRRMVRSRSQ